MRFLVLFFVIGIISLANGRTICLEPNKTDVWPPLSLSEYVDSYNFTIRTDVYGENATVLVVGSLVIPDPPILREHSVYNVSRYARGWTKVVQDCDNAVCFYYDRFLLSGAPSKFRACYEIKAYPYGKIVRMGWYIVMGAIGSACLIMGIISIVVCLLRRRRKRSQDYRALDENPEDKDSSSID